MMDEKRIEQVAGLLATVQDNQDDHIWCPAIALNLGICDGCSVHAESVDAQQVAHYLVVKPCWLAYLDDKPMPVSDVSRAAADVTKYVRLPHGEGYIPARELRGGADRLPETE